MARAAAGGSPAVPGREAGRGASPSRHAGRNGEVSDRAKRKTITKTTPDGFLLHSFPTLLGDLSTIALDRVVLPAPDQAAVTVATKVQRKAFDLLGVDPHKTVPMTATG